VHFARNPSPKFDPYSPIKPGPQPSIYPEDIDPKEPRQVPAASYFCDSYPT
jgi:hypothetical protein